MKKSVFALLLLALIGSLLLASPASAAGPQWVVVNWGDTLAIIAARYGTTVGALMQANRLPDPNFVYAGQRLLVPANGQTSPAGSTSPNKATTATYTVRPGDTLHIIAARYGTTVAALASANRLWDYNFIYTGQVLKIPGASVAPANPSAPATNPTVAGKWIDVNISKQTITAYEGSKALKTVLVSTGVAIHPTVVGRFAVYAKYSAYTMSGGTRGVDYYYLPNVPWTMFFYKGFAIHGTYWHSNFGHPMSHGCVNLTIADAKWFYDWAPVGTPVVSHY